MISYRTIKEKANVEIVVKGSRFLGAAHPVDCAEEAEAIIAALAKEHPFATHICYAYKTGGMKKASVAAEQGTAASADISVEPVAVRSSDDGEPKGTAGAPLAEVIKKSGLVNVLLTVTRYFGGIKLGAGGLARAYGGTGADALAAAAQTEMRLVKLMEAVFDFSAAARILNLRSGTEVSRNYMDCVTVRFRTANPAELQNELSAILGKETKLKLLGEEWASF